MHLVKLKETKKNISSDLSFTMELIKKSLEDIKAKDISLFDVRQIYDYVDFIFIATGTSNIHIKGIINNLQRVFKNESVDLLGKEVSDSWCLLDLGEVVVHIFNKETRHYYQLEKMYSF